VLLCDVNVYVSAHRPDSTHHEAALRWHRAVLAGDHAYAFSDLVLSAFVRIVTNRRVFQEPSELAQALAFTGQIRDRPQAVRIEPGPRHWELFTGLCRSGQARGNTVPDAYLAALAIETGCDWVTFDSGFARFPGLRWRRPGG
jgi:toxin-antitoxin system PIN domain toxin